MSSSSSIRARQEPVRSCDGCTLCCKVMGIQELEKPAGSWCQHCKAGSGCGIYDKRPGECRDFVCAFLMLATLSEAWRPSRSKLIVTRDPAGNTIVHVDPARPNAWREEPYYSEMRAWSRNAAAERKPIVVAIARRTIVMLPDEDVDLGVLGDDEVIVMGERPVFGGVRLHPYKALRPKPGEVETIAAAATGDP